MTKEQKIKNAKEQLTNLQYGLDNDSGDLAYWWIGYAEKKISTLKYILSAIGELGVE